MLKMKLAWTDLGPGPRPDLRVGLGMRKGADLHDFVSIKNTVLSSILTVVGPSRLQKRNQLEILLRITLTRGLETKKITISLKIIAAPRQRLLSFFVRRAAPRHPYFHACAVLVSGSDQNDSLAPGAKSTTHAVHDIFGA